MRALVWVAFYLAVVGCFILAAACSGPAEAAREPLWGSGDIRARVCTLETLRSDPVPSQAVVRKIRAFANGRELGGTVTGPRSAYFYGRGVAIQVRVFGRTSPIVFRVANLRTGGCSRVRVTYRWTR